MKKNVLLAGACFLAMMCSTVFAQGPPVLNNTQPTRNAWQCGTDQMMKLNLQMDPGMPARLMSAQQEPGKYGNNSTYSGVVPTTPFIIPVVFHVIKDASISTPIPTYEQLQWQLASLNAAFSNNLNILNNVTNGPHGTNVQVQFCLAKYRQVGPNPGFWPNSTPGMINYVTGNSGISNIYTGNNSSYISLAALTNIMAEYPPNRYLNIFCVPNITSNLGASVLDPPGIIGMGTFPWMGLPIDGIIMRNDCMGNNYYGQFTANMLAPLDKGNILVHEAGHYLGLFHTFETLTGSPPNLGTAGATPGCFGMTLPNDEGDLIYDTPPTSMSYQYPYPTINTCNETYAPYGINADEDDQLENFMSYSDDDKMSTFTKKQGERIWGALDPGWSTYFLSGQRANLSTTSNLNATGVNLAPSCGPNLLTAAFNYTVDLLSISCSSISVNFQTPSLPPYLSATSWFWDFGDGTSSALPNPTHVYSLPPSVFVVTLTVTDGSTVTSLAQTINIPTVMPDIVGQGGSTVVCKGTEQTILVRFPPGFATVYLTDGTTTYTVQNNIIHACSYPSNAYIYPFTFTVTNSGTWSISPGPCLPSTPGVATFSVVDCCSNLVRNGDIEAGAAGFYSDYALSAIPCGGVGCAFAGIPWWSTQGVLTFDSDMYQSFPGFGCQYPGFRKILVGQMLAGLKPSTNYYLSYKTGQSYDSISTCGPNKFNFRLFSGSPASALVNQNMVPSTIPWLSCSTTGGTQQNAWQVFNFMITTPATITPATQFSLELSEVNNSNGYAFDYAFDDITLRELTPPINISPLTASVCVGGSVQLTASGNCVNLTNYTLSWSPAGSLSCNTCTNPIATVTANTIYTLTATPPVQVPPLPVIVQTVAVSIISPVITVTSPTPLCYPVTYTMTASSVTSATWQPGPVVGLTYTASTPGIYTVTGVSAGCTKTGTVNIVQPVVSLTAKGGTYCANSPAGTGAVISATYLPTGAGPTYSWQPGGLTGQTQTVMPSSNTIYTVYVVTTAGCTMQNTVSVISQTNCCPVGIVAPIAPTLVTSGTLFGPQIILNDITVGGPSWVNATLTGPFLIAPGVKITVTPNREFLLKHAHLYACGTNMWQGIIIQDGADIISNQGTLIEDAITAIDVSNITPAHINFPIEISNTTFNKNYVSVNIANSTGITGCQMFLTSSVFTSRDIPFTNTTWPDASTSPGGLRYASTTTAAITSPYLLNGYALANLKYPYNTQPAHIGIQISNINNTVGGMPTAGILIGNTSGPTWFDLFDNVGTGMDVTNSSLTTFNNVFQNLRRYSTPMGTVGGTGIKSNITSLMNAGLFLNPPGGYSDYGNMFWDCYIGIEATNVFRLDGDYVAMRSTQTTGLLTPAGFLRGNTGISFTTNRFIGSIKYGVFNNIKDAILINFTNGNYNVGAGLQTGTYANDFVITQCYFGPQINSSTPLVNSEFLYSGVTVNANAAGSWQSAGGMSIISNKINRSYNGVYVNGLGGHPLDLSGNNITLVNDVLGLTQGGISLVNTRRSVKAGFNTVSGPGTSNVNVTAFYCDNNVHSTAQSPYITCNTIDNTYRGFVFNGNNKSTLWMGNSMKTHQYGYMLTNSGFINTQGSGGNPSDNQWNGAWPAGTFQTYVIASSAPGSKLFVRPGPPQFNPTVNGAATPGQDYFSTASLINTAGTGNYACPSATLQPGPSYKEASAETGISEKDKINNFGLEIFPNPASDQITIRSVNEKDQLSVRIIDITGKVIMIKNISMANGVAGIDLEVEQGVYMMEIVNSQQQKMISKLVIAK